MCLLSLDYFGVLLKQYNFVDFFSLDSPTYSDKELL